MSLIERLLGQLTRAGIEECVLVTGFESEQLQEHVLGLEGMCRVRFAHNTHWESQNNAESLRVGMDGLQESGARRFLLCDGDVLLQDSQCIYELLRDRRPNVLAMIMQLQHRLGEEEMKLQLEPVDVPWYSRRVVGLSKALVPSWCHGESIGIQTIGADFFPVLKNALEGLTLKERESLYYEDVFSRFLDAGHEFFTFVVDANAWTEIDTIEDLTTARAMAQSWTTTALAM